MSNLYYQRLFLGAYTAFHMVLLAATQPLYFCIAADARYFNQLINLIGSIQRHNFSELGEIAVFDLGLNKDHKRELQCIQKVRLYSIEQTNPDIFTPYVARRDGRKVPGFYSWKPVVIKQALDLFPYVLYLDSGITVVGSLVNLFEHIRQNKCFFIDTGTYSIKWMSTRHIIEKFDLESPARRWILGDTVYGLSAGIQGLTRALYDDYVLPVYELTKDIKNFFDDGTSPTGFGDARSDQTIYSIYARLLGLPIFYVLNGDVGYLAINKQKIPFILKDFLILSRENINVVEARTFIHYNNPAY